MERLSKNIWVEIFHHQRVFGLYFAVNCFYLLTLNLRWSRILNTWVEEMFKILCESFSGRSSKELFAGILPVSSPSVNSGLVLVSLIITLVVILPL